MLIGPGGAGKGTVAERLVAQDPTLWLSRSWTTRDPRPGEGDHSYVFVDRGHVRGPRRGRRLPRVGRVPGPALRHAQPHAPPGADVLLEIDIQGARQVAAARPEAIVVLLLPPSPEVQAVRLEGRGDSAEQVAQRIEKGLDEVRLGREIAQHVVVNDDVERATGEVAGIVDRARSSRRPV